MFDGFCLALSPLNFAHCHHISFSMFRGLIDGRLERVLEDFDEGLVTEVRLRVGKPLVFFQGGVRCCPRTESGVYVVTRDDVDRVLGIASDFSIYAVNDQLTKGYLVKDGIRIGVVGRGVVEGGRIVTVKDVNALVLRIPHEVKGCADKVIERVLDEGYPHLKSTLVISPPGAGKTTLLRDMARQVSAHLNTLVIDERFELGGVDGTLDLGESEVMSGVPKAVAYEFGVRSTSPQLIVTDELFRREDIEAVKDIMRCGVKVFASVHGKNFDDLKRSETFARIEECFQCFVTLAPIGKIVSIYEK